MVVYVTVPGHGEIPAFKDEDELMQYDASMVKAGRATFPIGAKCGVEHNVTAVAENGEAVLVNHISSSQSAPTSQYGAPFAKPIVYERTFRAPNVGGKPVVYERTFGAPVYYGIEPISWATIVTLIKIIAVILAMILMTYIATLIAKAAEATNPKSRTYTDGNGDTHTTYTSGGGLFGSAKVIDINEANGKVTTVMGGSDILNIGLGAIGIVVACGVGYVVYKKVSADAKKKEPKVVAEKKEE
jgi:hypothetical protein